MRENFIDKVNQSFYANQIIGCRKKVVSEITKSMKVNPLVIALLLFH